MKTNILTSMLLMVALGLPTVTSAQTFSWAKKVSSTNSSSFIFPTANTLDANGNYYVIGHFNGTLDFDPGTAVVNLTGNTNGQDIYIQKFSPAGNLIWAKGIVSASAYSECSSIATDASGNVYLAGTFDDVVDFNPGTAVNNIAPNGFQDIFILKLDASGNFVFVKNIGSGFAFPSVGGLALTSTGNIVVGGSYDDVLDFDPGAAVVNKTPLGQDAFLLSLTSAGIFNWVKTFESISFSTIQRVKTDAANNIIVSGGFNDTTDFDPGVGVVKLVSNTSVNFTSDVFIVKLDNAGNYVWAKTVGGAEDETVSDMTIDNTNAIIISGDFSGQVDFDPGAATFNLITQGQFNTDNFILKLNSAGNFVWAKQLKGSSTGFIASITTDNLGMVYATGYFDDTVDFNPGPAVNNLTTTFFSIDGFILKLDATGGFIRVHHIQSTTGDEGGFVIAVNNTLDIYSSGIFETTIDLDPQATVQNLISAGIGLDAYYLKWGQCTPSTTTINATGCTYVLNNQTYSGNGTYTQLFTSATGCDSIVTLNLSGSSTNTSISPTVCNGNFVLNGTTYTQTGNYVQNYLNQAGCDSNIFINLTVGMPSFNTIQITACDFYISGQNFYSFSGTYNEVYTNASGCDSNLTLVLTIHQSSFSQQNITSCAPYNFNGTILSSSGMYSFLLFGANGCDSMVDINFTLTPQNKTVNLSGATLTSAAISGTTYQWVTCPSYTPIPAATMASYTPTVNGAYAVILTNGNCKDTTACTNVVVSSVKNNHALSSLVRIYPNPVQHIVNVQFDKKINHASLKLTTMSGQLLQSQIIENAMEANFDMKNFAPGIYFINLIADNQRATFKVVKE